MVGSRLTVAVALLLASASIADAQPHLFTGLLTAQVGAAAQGDIRDWVVMPAISMAVLDRKGLGVELDAGYASDIDNTQFADSAITAVMVNVIAMYPHERFRPFVAAGAGILRVRATLPPVMTQTDAGWNAGGGVLYMFNEVLGVRGDVRYFRHFGRLDTIPLGANRALTFVRSSVGITFSWPLE